MGVLGLLAQTSAPSFLKSYASADKSRIENAAWQILETLSSRTKQDDIFFLNGELGWYVNGEGCIYHTSDGGTRWTAQAHQPGTYFRAIGFADEMNGFAGNIGPDYFPGVSDSIPLYHTKDGGATWLPVAGLTGDVLKGVCAIDVLKTLFINAGELNTRITVRAAGRVGGPAMMATSRDGGATWKTEDLSAVAGMILDVKFVSERTGFLCAGSHPDIEKSRAKILKTTDGGSTWRAVYESVRPFEVIWKCAFPTDAVGYATVQSYEPDQSADQRIIIKTTDGGETWEELPLVKDFAVREFGIGFLDADIGWVGTKDGGWLTLDGGKSWIHQNMGTAVNKIRVVPTPEGPVVYAIGFDVRKLDLRSQQRPSVHQSSRSAKHAP